MPAFAYHEPRTLAEAFETLERCGDGAHLLAGGTALVPLMRVGLAMPEHLIALRAVPGMGEIGILPDGGLEIGALVTHREIERSALVARFCPALSDAFASVATIRVRNQATIGGNLVHADPASDPPPILLALDARVVVGRRDGTREVPLAEFFTGLFETALTSGEIVTAIRIPPQTPVARACYRKFLPGSKDDFATVSVAVVAALDDAGTCTSARLALGGVAPSPMRAFAAEAELTGKAVSLETIEAAAAAAEAECEPMDDGRGSAAYKRAMTRVWVRRALRETLQA